MKRTGWPGCSTISFRHLPLPSALAVIAECGFGEIDLGALPGVCDHVPYDLTDDAVRAVAAEVAASGLRVRSVNGDIGDLNRPHDEAERAAHLRRLLDLTAACGADALVLPCGAQSHDPVATLDEDLDLIAAQLHGAAEAAAGHGVAIWVEAPHFHRLCWNTGLAGLLADRLDPAVGLVLDTSHIVASGGDPAAYAERFAGRIAHVHLRDATPGHINHSIGNGVVDFAATFAALRATGYQGASSLELETRDVTDDERPAAAVKAAAYIAGL
ncbi:MULTISPECIES: sugar phosphate isomerase/epimerase family protein [Amycolatopsis]|uniref:Sugar phosphate isomerase/epimerase n=1 Tax=Amycolatopsis thermalba TaxID=944492 RepID=A0ABY4NUW0_9PSEU|nr:MULTISPECIES: sugar phosphate isomerase/epimerase [Amycolatopsis]OXM72760.1 xylose isomerase [Amycolatopsis sp. KNN50.9b]UQS23856.1 sugar phosphate isomerase/epimerase [Amycolatopsis thermalba]